MNPCTGAQQCPAQRQLSKSQPNANSASPSSTHTHTPGVQDKTGVCTLAVKQHHSVPVARRKSVVDKPSTSYSFRVTSQQPAAATSKSITQSAMPPACNRDASHNYVSIFPTCSPTSQPNSPLPPVMNRDSHRCASRRQAVQNSTLPGSRAGLDLAEAQGRAFNIQSALSTASILLCGHMHWCCSLVDCSAGTTRTRFQRVCVTQAMPAAHSSCHAKGGTEVG